jgi:glycosyltransferase involved in cell wall biosynthesis
MGISLIFATDGITVPLSGIGRYALELVLGLRARPQIDSLRCLSFGRWVNVPVRSEVQESGASGRGRLRAALAGSRAAVRIYHGFMPSLSRWQLRAEGSALFHSPNFLLPPFPGVSVATIHDLSHILYPQFHPAARVDYMNLAFPQTLSRATHLITDAESVRHELIQRMEWPADRVTAVPLGVDASFRQHDVAELQPLMRRLGLRSNEYSLCVGTIEPRKNIDRLLTAYEALPSTLRRNFPLVLAGARGWRSTEIHARIARAESAGWVRYLAFVPEHELPMLYAGARLFVYPSLYEGFGLPVLEAMASGVPVITSNVASLPELVGDAAWLIDPKDTDQIAGSLQELLQNEERRCRARAAGLARSASFTWAECVSKTIAVYLKVMSADPARFRR